MNFFHFSVLSILLALSLIMFNLSFNYDPLRNLPKFLGLWKLEFSERGLQELLLKWFWKVHVAQIIPTVHTCYCLSIQNKMIRLPNLLLTCWHLFSFDISSGDEVEEPVFLDAYENHITKEFVLLFVPYCVLIVFSFLRWHGYKQFKYLKLSQYCLNYILCIRVRKMIRPCT